MKINKNKRAATISSFLIGIIFASLFTTGFILFMNEGQKNYAVTYDNTSIVALNQMERVTNLTEDIQESATSISERSGALDLIGSLFTSGYQTLLLTLESLNIFSTMADIAFQMIGLGAFGAQIKIALVTIVVITIIFGVILATVLKRDI